MAYEGYVDATNERAIAGWVFDSSRENDPLTVEILAGHEVVATIRADTFRPDLLDVGKGNGRHAFHFTLPESAPSGPPLAARIQGKRWHIQYSTPGKLAPVYHDPRRIYSHTLDFGYPQVASGFTSAPAPPDERAIVGRIVEAFHRALKDDPEGGRKEKDLWSEIHSIYHREPYDLLRRRDIGGLSDYLRDAHAKGLTFGITQGIESTAMIRSNPDAARAVTTQFVDNLVSLSEYLGILDVESPEQRGQYGENLHVEPQVLVDQIASELGFSIEVPPVISSYFGIKTRGGIVTGRDICALYAALRMRDTAVELGVPSPRICEIGGGLGGVAFYAARMGFRYTIIDLPLVSVLQGYFLLRALPDLDIRLYGEGESASAAIELRPTFCFGEDGRQYDILLNQDSFPEMSTAYSLNYLRRARECVRHAFYSVNQEARAPQSNAAKQSVVRELVQQAGGWRRVSRGRHWLRSGYVEELYRKAGG